MLKFLVFEDGRPASQWPIRNAYLLGSDNIAMRGTITYREGLVVCEKREGGVAALALQTPVGECGEITVQTCLLPERDEPYLLNLELARHRLMTLYTKSEDWGMLDLPADHPVARRMERARKLFIEALCEQKDNPIRADKLARESLAASIDGSEELALAHAEILLGRRKQTGALPRQVFGCSVALTQRHERLRGAIAANFDFINLPTPWKLLVPEEGGHRWEAMDEWVDWAGRSQIPVVAGPLISFDPGNIPDWLFIWEHDYETVRDLVYEHIERMVARYRDKVFVWNVVSGLHINTHFTFAFDQLMDLTRMANMLVKKIQPNAKVLVEIRQPFGEYFGANQRSIPPLMYADLLAQGGIGYDGLSLELLMGQAQAGQFTRDLMQLSNLLDQYQPFGKPLHLAVAAPSEMVTQEMILPITGNQPADANCGYWRKPWSPMVQAHWLEALYHIALSKPFVETVTWHEVMDHPEMDLALGGLIGEELQPKSAFRRLVGLKRSLTNVPA